MVLLEEDEEPEDPSLLPDPPEVEPEPEPVPEPPLDDAPDDDFWSRLSVR